MTNEFRHRAKMQIVIDGKVQTYEGTVIISTGEKPTDAETQLRHNAVIRDERRKPPRPEHL